MLYFYQCELHKGEKIVRRMAGKVDLPEDVMSMEDFHERREKAVKDKWEELGWSELENTMATSTMVFTEFHQSN